MSLVESYQNLAATAAVGDLVVAALGLVRGQSDEAVHRSITLCVAPHPPHPAKIQSFCVFHLLHFITGASMESSVGENVEQRAGK